jgi:ribosomal protein L11 methyltransferase
MNRRSLWKLSVATSVKAEEAVAELLSQVLSRPVCSYTGMRTSRATVIAYLESKSAWTRAQRQRLRTGLDQLRAGGLNVGTGRLRLARIRWEDWANSWKRHFQPLEIGPKLLLQPTWSRRRARRGQAVVRLDPGLSFGTGRHPTTAFCLRQIVARRTSGTPQPFLDLGTGSGILAIAAAKLGYGPIEAWEVDLDAIEVARANARRNHVAHRIRFLQRDVRELPVRGGRPYALLCANLSTDLLLRERRRIVSGLRPDGILVLAGILEREFASVKRAYESAGLRLLATRREREWRSGAFLAHAPR